MSKIPLDAFATAVGILLRMNEMKSIRFLLILFLWAFCWDSNHHAEGKDLESEFKPGVAWLDTDGKPINAHGGGMLYHNKTYY